MEVLHSNLLQGTLLQSESPLLVQRALNKPTLLEACIILPGGCCVGLTNTSLRKGLTGFPAWICSTPSEYWDHRVSV